MQVAHSREEGRQGQRLSYVHRGMLPARSTWRVPHHERSVGRCRPLTACTARAATRTSVRKVGTLRYAWRPHPSQAGAICSFPASAPATFGFSPRPAAPAGKPSFQASLRLGDYFESVMAQDTLGVLAPRSTRRPARAMAAHRGTTGGDATAGDQHFALARRLVPDIASAVYLGAV